MKIVAEFVTSAVDAAGFPRERLPELALVGRSNVGKSSLINALVRQKVARTSATPGKTRLANFYRVAAEGAPPFYFVDLPGYGYARAPRQVLAQGGRDAAARELETITGEYFGRSTGLAGLLQLVDARHPGLDSDLHAWRWISSLPVPSSVVATKLDKLPRSQRARRLKELERLHAGPVVGVSAETGEGLKELWELIATRLRPLPPTTPPSPPLPPNKKPSTSAR